MQINPETNTKHFVYWLNWENFHQETLSFQPKRNVLVKMCCLEGAGRKAPAGLGEVQPGKNVLRESHPQIWNDLFASVDLWK